MAKRAANPVAIDPQTAVRARFVEHGTDPSIAKKALEDATGLSRGLWLSFLTFGTYLVITFAGVTHRDLLLETPITLPVLNAKLPLVTFFWVAPILFVIFHLYLLLSLKLLADQVHSYVDKMEEVGLDSDAQDRARLQLPNFVVVQVLGGTSSQINSWAGRLMRFTAFLTLVAGPLILLLFAQLMFLPYHGWWVTMAQRVLVVVDLAMIWYFWRAIRRTEQETFRVWGNLASAAVVALTFFVFMYPGERFYGPLSQGIFEETGYKQNENIFAPIKEVGLAILYNTLVLPGELLVDDSLFQKLKTRNNENGLLPWEGERSLAGVLKNRDFRQAVFSDIDLRKADLSQSHFENADLRSAALQEVNLTFAHLQGALIQGAYLQGANLEFARLQGASLTQASLQGAFLDGASLHGALLIGTDLQGAQLRGTYLQGTKLWGANFKGATFTNASLQGAQLSQTNLQGVLLRNITVWRNTGRPLIGPTAFNGIEFLSYETSLQRLQNYTAASYEKLLADALVGVSSLSVNSVVEAISVLDPSKSNPVDMFDWTQSITNFEATNDFKVRMVKSLTDTACDSFGAPYVAQSIVRMRLKRFDADVGKEGLPMIDQLLTNCPGLAGIDRLTIAALKQLQERYVLDLIVPKKSGR